MGILKDKQGKILRIEFDRETLQAIRDEANRVANSFLPALTYERDAFLRFAAMADCSDAMQARYEHDQPILITENKSVIPIKYVQPGSVVRLPDGEIVLLSHVANGEYTYIFATSPGIYGYSILDDGLVKVEVLATLDEVLALGH